MDDKVQKELGEMLDSVNSINDDFINDYFSTEEVNLQVDEESSEDEESYEEDEKIEEVEVINNVQKEENEKNLAEDWINNDIEKRDILRFIIGMLEFLEHEHENFVFRYKKNHSVQLTVSLDLYEMLYYIKNKFYL